MSMEKMRDSIDFKNTDIKTLFRKLLLPTVLGDDFLRTIRYHRRHLCRKRNRQ